MRIILGILGIFTRTAMGLLFQDPVVCRFNENDQCYVALGRRLHLQIPPADVFNLKTGDKTSVAVFRFRNAQSNSPKPNTPRWKFVNENYTLILTSAESSDSGTYYLETFDKRGTFTGKSTLQLNIEAEVSMVNVMYICLLSGDMSVYCSADGNNITYNWTSNLHPHAQLENGTSTHTLSKKHKGYVTCYIKNHVSHQSNTTDLQQCSSSILLFVFIWVLEIIVFLSLLVGTHLYTRVSRKQRITRCT